MNKEKEITITELAQEMRAGFATIRETLQQGFEILNAKTDKVEEDFQEFRKEAKGRFDDLEKGLFTEEEKEKVMSMARHYDRWLEEDTLGKTRITLTRPEYNATSRAQGFPNRFENLAEIAVE